MFEMSELIQYLLPLVAFMATLREGVIMWALKLSTGIGCAAGLITILVLQDVPQGCKMMMFIGIGSYIVMYLIVRFKYGRRNGTDGE